MGCLGPEASTRCHRSCQLSQTCRAQHSSYGASSNHMCCAPALYASLDRSYLRIYCKKPSFAVVRHAVNVACCPRDQLICRSNHECVFCVCRGRGHGIHGFKGPAGLRSAVWVYCPLNDRDGYRVYRHVLLTWPRPPRPPPLLPPPPPPVRTIRRVI
eukprot:6173206-Pleurochrysis_carterae.AAC.2